MSRGNVPIYIVVFAISTVIVLGVQSLRHSANPLSRALSPIKMQQYQLIWNYYCLYVACRGCCKYLYVPRISPDSITLELYPTWNFGATHQGQLQNTSPLNNYSVINQKNLSALLQRMEHYKLLLLNTPLQESGILPVINIQTKSTLQSSIKISKPVKKINGTTKTINALQESGILPVINTQTKSTLQSSIKISKPVKKFNGTTKTINASAAKVGVIPKNNDKSGRRTDKVITANAKSDIQSSEFLRNITHGDDIQNTADHVLNTGNVSIINSPLDAVTKETIPKVNYEPVQLKTATNDTSSSRSVTDKTNQSNDETKRHLLFRKFRNQLDQVERKFLLSVFKKLSAISPEDRKENGISFLQSAFFLYQLLLSLSMTLDRNVVREIEVFLGSNMPEAEKIEILERTVKWLPKSNDVLKFRWSSRLVLRRESGENGGLARAAARGSMQLSWLDGNETAAYLTESLNNMVLSDTEGSMHDTFEEDEVAGGVCAAVLGTACVRGTWRAAPTLLNDSLPFRDAPAAPNRTSRFFRLNDIMGYSHLHEWDAEAIEISYASPGLTLLILVPKEPSLRPLVERVASAGLDHVIGFMRPMRLAVTLPLYTLRMTLLLPNKLEDMGMPSLITNGTNCQPVKLSHAVQRLMFWAEAGRNAFKDDGIEWDPRPELEIVVDRPHLFFVRWHNITIMNGVFAL